eukprot:g6943.t1
MPKTYNTRKKLEQNLEEIYKRFFDYLKSEESNKPSAGEKVNQFIVKYNNVLYKLSTKVKDSEMLRYRRKFFKIEKMAYSKVETPSSGVSKQKLEVQRGTGDLIAKGFEDEGKPKAKSEKPKATNNKKPKPQKKPPAQPKVEMMEIEDQKPKQEIPEDRPYKKGNLVEEGRQKRIMDNKSTGKKKKAEKMRERRKQTMMLRDKKMNVEPDEMEVEPDRMKVDPEEKTGEIGDETKEGEVRYIKDKRPPVMAKLKQGKNVKALTEQRQLALENAQEQKVREVAPKESQNFVDPVVGENNIENAALAVVEFKEQGGQGIHTQQGSATQPQGQPQGQAPQQAPMDDEQKGEEPQQPPEPMQVEPQGEAQPMQVEPQQPAQAPQQPPAQAPAGQPMGGQPMDGTAIDVEKEQFAYPNQGGNPLGIKSTTPTIDVEKENKDRVNKSHHKLMLEIKCYREIFKSKIKTKKFKNLGLLSLKGKSISDIRKIHKAYSDEVRHYYNGQHGLRVGVIVDPAVLGLNLQALQGIMAPRVPSYAPVIDAGRKQEGFEMVGNDMIRSTNTTNTCN